MIGHLYTLLFVTSSTPPDEGDGGGEDRGDAAVVNRSKRRQRELALAREESFIHSVVAALLTTGVLDG